MILHSLSCRTCFGISFVEDPETSSSYRGLSPLLYKPARKLSFRLANVLPDAVFLISSGLAGFLIKSLNSDEFKSTGLGNEKSELKTLKYSVKKEKL